MTPKPFKQFNMYEHKETIATSDTPQRIYGEHQIQMLEISDEEIEKASYDQATFAPSFIAGAKWYREQLKKKQ